MGDHHQLPNEPSYRSLLEQLERTVRAVCPRWMQDYRDDIVQGAAMRLHRLVTRSEGNMVLTSSYIWRTVHSVLVDEVRRVRNRRERPMEDESPGSLPASSRPDPEAQTASRELGVEILECLTHLVPPRRMAAVLYLQGHTVPETATLLGFTAKKTENLVYRGMANLRSCLERKGLRP